MKPGDFRGIRIRKPTPTATTTSRRALPLITAIVAAVDGIESVLRTGFNIGIYKSYETQIRIQNARTGEIVQSQTLWNW